MEQEELSGTGVSPEREILPSFKIITFSRGEGRNTCAVALMSEDSLWESLLFLNHLSSGLEFKLSGLLASTFFCWTILLAPSLDFRCLYQIPLQLVLFFVNEAAGFSTA